MLTKRKVGFGCGVLLLNVACCLARDVCYYNNNNFEVYCDDGYYCCHNNTRCCSEGISVGAIIGITLAAIFVLAICVAGSIMMMKKKNAPGRRIRHGENVQHNVQNISVINPPPYSQFSNQPPNYNQSNQSGNYFAYNQPQAPPPYAAPYQPPPAYSAT